MVLRKRQGTVGDNRVGDAVMKLTKLSFLLMNLSRFDPKYIIKKLYYISMFITQKTQSHLIFVGSYIEFRVTPTEVA